MLKHLRSLTAIYTCLNFIPGYFKLYILTKFFIEHSFKLTAAIATFKLIVIIQTKSIKCIPDSVDLNYRLRKFHSIHSRNQYQKSKNLLS